MRNAMLSEMLRVAAVAAGILLMPPLARAHCDTMQGPVIEDARRALEQKSVTPVLKWVRAADEPEVRDAFAKALAVRGKGPQARELADRFFFETVVRVHRAGEGAPFTGLKSDEPLDPAIGLADEALKSGSVGALVKAVSDAVGQGVRERFERALKARAHADDSVEAGRAYVEAYVDYVHFVERVTAVHAADGDHGADGLADPDHGDGRHAGAR